MSSNRLQRYALTAEIIGGIAIVVSLIFVGIEVRHSAKAQRAASYQSLIESINDINTLKVGAPGLAETLADLENYDAMSEAEQIKVFAYIISIYRHGDLAYFQFKQGIIDEEQLKSVLMIVIDSMSSPIGKRIWETRKEGRVFSKDYTDYVDALLLEGIYYVPPL